MLRFSLSHFPPAQNNLQTDWVEAGGGAILRRCPVCARDSIIGHGRRRKQAHDEHHDWIAIRRGLCNLLREDVHFPTALLSAYTHYSLIARSQALRRYFVEALLAGRPRRPRQRSRRVTDPSTLRRWFRSLDCSQPPFSFLRSTMQAVCRALDGGKLLQLGGLRLCWRTLFPCLGRCWPLRL